MQIRSGHQTGRFQRERSGDSPLGRVRFSRVYLTAAEGAEDAERAGLCCTLEGVGRGRSL